MIETAIRTRLLADSDVTGYVGSRIYVLRAEQGAGRPSIVLNTLTKRRFPSTAGANPLVSSRFQVDCYADNYIDAKALADEVRINLHGLTGAVGSEFVRSCLLDSEQDIDERPLTGKDKGPARVSQTYVIQHTEATS